MCSRYELWFLSRKRYQSVVRNIFMSTLAKAHAGIYLTFMVIPRRVARMFRIITMSWVGALVVRCRPGLDTHTHPNDTIVVGEYMFNIRWSAATSS